MLTILDLFSGGGGLHLASESTGRFRTIAFSEIEAHPSAVLKRRWPDIPNLGDIRQITDPPKADVVIGGFPCQDISVAGSGTGLKGKRSGLWAEMARIIRKTQPRGVLIENSNQLAKRGLDIVLQDLATAGYDAEWYTVAASAAGAPHRRQRLVIVAYRVGARGPGLVKTLSLGVAGQWDWAGEKDLREIYSRPFVPGSRWPQPLLRRVDDGLANRSHRLRVIGNGVCVPLFAQVLCYLADILVDSH